MILTHVNHGSTIACEAVLSQGPAPLSRYESTTLQTAVEGTMERQEEARWRERGSASLTAIR
jgi:hypothetical protein